jgi:hypothetical protein
MRPHFREPLRGMWPHQRPEPQCGRPEGAAGREERSGDGSPPRAHLQRQRVAPIRLEHSEVQVGAGAGLLYYAKQLMELAVREHLGGTRQPEVKCLSHGGVSRLAAAPRGRAGVP